MNCISKDTPPAGKKPAIMGTLPDGSEQEVKCSVDEPLAAFVFKTIADPFVGRISIFKVNAGVIKNNMTVYNASKDKEERIGGLFYLVGKEANSYGICICPYYFTDSLTKKRDRV